MTAADMTGSSGDHAYEGLLGESYARFMDSPWLQRLDAWLLGMKVDRYYEGVLSQLSRLGSGPHLDLPAGGGPFLRHAPAYRHSGPWLLADLSWTMLRRLRQKCQSMGLRDTFLIRADARRLPFNTGAIGNIVSLFGFHCFHEKDRVFSEMRRCLAPEGRIIASTLTTDGSALSRFYLRLHERDGTFATDNSLDELQHHALAHSLDFHLVQRLGAAILFEARHAVR
ncbi:class I SAM-dependent methyltransferase [Eleftheria terrae]|uniref:class I SAM-dependent methyltransferase n=1 Tax=Eleftheria terrae TaxID=1597781 RepID=UPI00263BB5E1|nr:class I SAM-dependent methyltransferase [Eleftheria terrae]WKB55737.1 class I SAM-dependent methyltransferase [Eleftheria terrae]